MGKEDKNRPVLFTCLATSESGQEPEHGGEWSPDFLLASVTQDPCNNLLVVTLPTSWEVRTGPFLRPVGYLQVDGPVRFLQRTCNFNHCGKIPGHSLSSEIFLPQKAGLYPTRHDPEQSDQVFMSALL